MLYIGIDPGKAGAVACIYDNLTQLDIHDCPVNTKKVDKKYKKSFDVPAMSELISSIVKDADEVICYLETAGARPKQGLSSTFNIGYGYGLWMGILASNRVPVVEVRPRKWKEFFSLSSDKSLSIPKATQLIPNSKSFFTLKKHVDRAEALLIAFYGYNQRP